MPGQCLLKSSAISSTALFLQSSGSNEGENMDAPLQDCTVEEQRGVVRFLWAEGVKRVEINRRMLAQYGQSIMNQSFMSGWKGLNRVEHVLLMKVVLVGHQHRAHKTTRAAEKLLLCRNTETS